MLDDPKKLRQQADRILSDVWRTEDKHVQRQLAANAFELVQLAEAIERLSKKAEIDLRIQELTEQLYKETDRARRGMHQKLLVQQANLYALSEQRLDTLYRLFVDCSGRVAKLRALLDQRPIDGDLLQQESLLGNFLDVQRLLEDSIRNELTYQNGKENRPLLEKDSRLPSRAGDYVEHSPIKRFTAVAVHRTPRTVRNGSVSPVQFPQQLNERHPRA